MTQFYTVLGVVFLGIFSLGLTSDVMKFAKIGDATTRYAMQELQSCHKMRSSMMDKFNGDTKDMNNLQGKQGPTGIAPIKLRSDLNGDKQPICSGTHLRAWIVLTTATCVGDYNATDLVVDVTYWKWGTVSTKTVDVSEIIAHPDSSPDLPDYDFALLIVYGELFWFENGFILPIFYFSPTFLHENHWETLHHRGKYDPQTKEYRTATYHTNITLDYKKCNVDETLEYFYCANLMDDPHDMNTMDMGSPFFIQDFTIKSLLAIYTGYNMESVSEANLYESIWPHFFWLHQNLISHIFPPHKQG